MSWQNWGGLYNEGLVESQMEREYLCVRVRMRMFNFLIVKYIRIPMADEYLQNNFSKTEQKLHRKKP